MKANITNLNDVLTLELRSLYGTEIELQKAVPQCNKKISEGRLHSLLQKYGKSAGDKLLKLERVFSHVMEEPVAESNKIIKQMLTEAGRRTKFSNNQKLKELLIGSCFKNLNYYKISTYQSAYLIAMDLELNAAADLLLEIIGWEQATRDALRQIIDESLHFIPTLNSADASHKA